MEAISPADIIRRIQTENPWWGSDHTIGSPYREMKPRPYFDLFLPLIKETRAVRRAVVLMGPRRVGKTVMIYHTIQQLINEGVSPKSICYFSVDSPVYNGLSIEKLLGYYGEASGVDYKSDEVFAFFDEIQYLRKWETSLKSIVDSYLNIRVIASGSAAAALRMKSQESGAGRFTDFLLPTLTFYEYMYLLEKGGLFEAPNEGEPGRMFFLAKNIEIVNEHFLHYLNYGGYPEVIFSPQIKSNPSRFIKSDIIDKVLLRDLPSLYGIKDIQELNSLFTALAFNTAKEVSLRELSQNSGVAKNTIKRYIQYLEAAFLIKIVHRIDHSAKRFSRANFFKVYLTNPSMRAALFSPIKEDDGIIGSLAETAVFSQWFHSSDTTLYYARWDDGEVDLVTLDAEQKVNWAVEVKWSDRPCGNIQELKGLISFCRANKLNKVLVTSKTGIVKKELPDIELEFIPTSLYCYTVGYNIFHGKKHSVSKEK
jgi:hypothetical protein